MTLRGVITPAIVGVMTQMPAPDGAEWFRVTIAVRPDLLEDPAARESYAQQMADAARLALEERAGS